VDFSEDIEGKSGLEAFYDDRLRGVNGDYVIFRDVAGNPLQKKIIKEAQPGLTMKTTIDADFQKYFYESFQKSLDSLGRNAGAGIAMDPKTGEILAMVSFPAYDNNNPAQYLRAVHYPLFNRAISGVYSPGSVIKPLVALAGLREKVMTPDFTVFSPGYLDVPNPYDPQHPSRFLDWKPQGVVNARSALARSSNVYFYTIGGGHKNVRGLGISRLKDYWKRFGFDKKTGIDLPAEAVGFLPDPQEKEARTGQPWRIGDTYNVSIGQGDLGVTPIRLLVALASIANNGRMMKPRLLADERPMVIMDYSDWQPMIEEVQKGLRDAVAMSYGTASLLYDLPYKTAGKTGSSQIQNNTKTNAFFVGYGPANDPKIAVLILVEDAKGGSLNAVPIARDVLKWYYERRL
jgi:penicillin-binding protein 2